MEHLVYLVPCFGAAIRKLDKVVGFVSQFNVFQHLKQIRAVSALDSFVLIANNQQWDPFLLLESLALLPERWAILEFPIVLYASKHETQVTQSAEIIDIIHEYIAILLLYGGIPHCLEFFGSCGIHNV